MSTIPQTTRLQRASISGQVRVGTPSVPRGDADMADDAQALGAVADIASTYGKARDKYELAKAGGDYLTAKAEQDNAYDEDDDYQTIPERYQAGVEERLGVAAASISNPTLRDEFVNRHRPGIAVGLERMQKVAFGKERDTERGTINDQMNSLRESGITGDMAAASTQVKEILDAASEVGYYDKEEKSKVFQAWRDSAAKGKLATMPAEQRVEALKQPWAKNLPSDVRAKLRLDAEDELRSDKAVAISDDMMAKGLDQAEALEAFEKIRDPKLRREVETRHANEVVREKKAKLDRQSEVMRTHYDDVRSGDLAIATIRTDNREEWDSLEPAQQEDLRRAEAAASKPVRKMSNPGVVDNLHILNRQKDWISLRDYYERNRSQLTPSDIDTWSKISIDGVIPADADLEITAQAYIASTLNKMNVTSKQAVGSIQTEWTKWNLRFQERTGQMPTDAEMTERVDILTREYADGSLVGFGTSRLSEMDDESKAYLFGKFEEEDPSTFKDTLEGFRLNKYDPTTEEFVWKYENLRESRGFKR